MQPFHYSKMARVAKAFHILLRRRAYGAISLLFKTVGVHFSPMQQGLRSHFTIPRDSKGYAALSPLPGMASATQPRWHWLQSNYIVSRYGSGYGAVLFLLETTRATCYFTVPRNSRVYVAIYFSPRR